MELAKRAGYDTVRLTAQWAAGQTSVRRARVAVGDDVHRRQRAEFERLLAAPVRSEGRRCRGGRVRAAARCDIRCDHRRRAQREQPGLAAVGAFDGTAQKGSTLPILYGEFGVETAIPAAKTSLYHGTQAAPAADEATQARYYAEALKLALCAPNVIGLTMFHVTDESDLAGWQSGLFYADGTPKASMWFVHAAISAARAGTLTRCPGEAAPTVSLQLGDGTVTANAGDDTVVGFRAPGSVRRFTARRGSVYRLRVSSLPLSWQG